MATSNWPSSALLDLIGTELPIIQAPMAGAQGADLAIAVGQAGGLGSLGCAILSANEIKEADQQIRRATNRPFNLNFFCHHPPETDAHAEAAWLARLAPYMAEYGTEPAKLPLRGLAPFDETLCGVVEDLRPKVVSFHFGLPEPKLLARVKQAGAVVLSSATTVAEARWLAQAGADAVIAQGLEAGGHRGMFMETDITGQVGTMALVPQIADAVDLPVIAAGGIADGRGLAAAMALGAAGAQIGTAYLLTPQSAISALHRDALRASSDQDSALTNVFSGRPARALKNRAVRELGPMAADAPAFPLGAAALTPLRKAAEASGSADFTPLWSGQAGALAEEIDAGELTRKIAADALGRLRALAGPIKGR
jgi:nitronate monooxygenase